MAVAMQALQQKNPGAVVSAIRARAALHAVDEHRGVALLLSEGSEPDDPIMSAHQEA